MRKLKGWRQGSCEIREDEVVIHVAKVRGVKETLSYLKTATEVIDIFLVKMLRTGEVL